MTEVFYQLLILSLIFCSIKAQYIEMQEISEENGSCEFLLTTTKNLRDEKNLIKELQFKFKAETEFQADITFKNLSKDSNRFSMPDIKPFDTLYRDLNSEKPTQSSIFKFVKDTNSNTFNFKIVRTSTNEAVFSGDNQMVFAENYLQYTTLLPSNDIFGLGERNYINFRLQKGLYTLNSVDKYDILEDGRSGANNIYSSQPVYLMREESGNYNVVFYKNPTPTDCIIEEKKITFKSIGGIIRFKIFFGDKNPETAIRLLHSYLGGGHALPPFWAFGFHQSRWGYPRSTDLLNVIERHQKNGIPLDTIWSDIDYMTDKQTFTVNSDAFPESFYKKLHEEIQINYVPIVDCGVGAKDIPINVALRKGLEMNIFCRSPKTGKRFKGKVWPGYSYFPDYFHPNSSEYWSFMMDDLFKKVNFTGMWLDMNEPANFWNGEYDWEDDSKNNEPNKDYQRDEIKLQYTPGQRRLDFNTLPLNLVHYGNYTHKDVHNLYGLMDAYLTHVALKKLKKIYPFILTRSSFTGSGRYTFKWTGDNMSQFVYLQLSIPSLINFNIFGIPFVGADICGFMGNTNDELCQRWIQLGSLYPFARNHNNDQPKSQEFYAQGDEVKKTSIKNLKLRYSILKHYFMLFVRTNHQGTVFRPLFFEFHSDKQCLEDQVLNNQFLLGSELMATPVVSERTSFTNAYFPKGAWFDLMSGYRVHQGEGSYKQIYNPLDDYVPLYLRSGNMIGFQDTTNVLKTQQLNNEFKLICVLREQQKDNTIYSCKGNILNLNNQLDEEEVQQSCDKEYQKDLNCILKVQVKVLTKEKKITFNVSSHKDNVWQAVSKLQIKNITINSILLYNFPNINSQSNEKNLKVQGQDGSSEQINVQINKYNYNYNRQIVFEKNKLQLSKISSFYITL